MKSAPDNFIDALQSNLAAFALEFSGETLTQLKEFYSLLIHWNERLHLVAPCTPEEFAVRHVLESLLLLNHLPQNARIADVGSGGGLPLIPCLIARKDLEATLIESSQKKVVFLREALRVAGRAAQVVARRFEGVETPLVSFVSSRALDQFMQQLPALFRWAPDTSTLLLFGGESLREQLQQANLNFSEELIPLSERRFLFRVTKQNHK